LIVNIPQGGLGLAAGLGTGSGCGSRCACWGRRELALLALHGLVHRGLLGLGWRGTGFFGVLLTLERIAKLLEAHIGELAMLKSDRLGTPRSEGKTVSDRTLQRDAKRKDIAYSQIVRPCKRVRSAARNDWSTQVIKQI
jgi:hypothetical protein